MKAISVEVSLLAVLVLLLAHPVRGVSNAFTALMHMEELLAAEKELLSSLDEYIASEKERYEIA